MSEEGDFVVFVDKGVFNFMEIEAVVRLNFLLEGDAWSRGTDEVFNSKVIECKGEFGMRLIERQGGCH